MHAEWLLGFFLKRLFRDFPQYILALLRRDNLERNGSGRKQSVQ